MGDDLSYDGKSYWAGCLRCKWVQTFDTRAEAAVAQTAHDNERHRPWRLSAQDREFLKVNRIGASEDEDE